MLKSYTKLTSGQFNSEKHKTYYQLLPQYYSKMILRCQKYYKKYYQLSLQQSYFSVCKSRSQQRDKQKLPQKIAF